MEIIQTGDVYRVSIDGQVCGPALETRIEAETLLLHLIIEEAATDEQ